MVPTISDSTSFTFFYPDNQPNTVTNDHPSSADIKRLVLIENKPEEALNLISVRTLVEVFSDGIVTIGDNDEVLVNKQPVPDYVANKICGLYRANEPFDSLANFMERLQENPNAEVREDLFKWVENGNMPLTPDGHFIAFKKIQDDFYSFTAGPDGKVLHALGTEVSMPRSGCDESRYNTCSRGLHFCSYEYLPKFAGGYGKVVAVMISPRDVTAIPTDYNLSKGRCCRYRVLNELDPSSVQFAFRGVEVYHWSPNLDVVPDDDSDSEDFVEPDYCIVCGEEEYYCSCNDDDDDYCPDCGIDRYDGCNCDS